MLILNNAIQDGVRAVTAIPIEDELSNEARYQSSVGEHERMSAKQCSVWPHQRALGAGKSCGEEQGSIHQNDRVAKLASPEVEVGQKLPKTMLLPYKANHSQPLIWF